MPHTRQFTIGAAIAALTTAFLVCNLNHQICTAQDAPESEPMEVVRDVRRSSADSIPGFGKEAKLAEKHLGRATTNAAEADFYLSAGESQLYVQTNYRTSESAEPLKMVSNDPFRTIEEVVGTLLPGSNHRRAGYVVDQRLLDSRKFNGIDFQNVDDIQILDEQGVRLPAMQLTADRGWSWGVRAFAGNDRLLFAPDFSMKRELGSFLQNVTFEPATVRYLHTGGDAAVIEKARQTLPPGVLLELPEPNPDALRTLFDQNKGALVIVDGVLSEGAFQVRGDGWKLTHGDLQRMAVEAHVTVMLVGCAVDRRGRRLSAISPSMVADAVAEASKATTYGEFLDGFMSERMLLLVDEAKLPVQSGVGVMRFHLFERKAATKGSTAAVAFGGAGWLTVDSRPLPAEVTTASSDVDAVPEADAGEEMGAWIFLVPVLLGMAILGGVFVLNRRGSEES